jgi:cyclase
MSRIRVIPALLIHHGGLVKSVRFRNYKYVGDPINAVKIFNEKEVDELVVLDIGATAEKRGPNLQQIREIASEAFMPLAYGGGITTVEEIRALIACGIEKVVLNTCVNSNPRLITEAAKVIGSQSVVVSIDTRKNFWGNYRVYVKNGKINTGKEPGDYARIAERAGAGEILLNAINQDGTFGGYDTELIGRVCSQINVPVVALGGAAKLSDFRTAIGYGASAVAAGSMFVFQMPHKAVLISYPSQKELKEKVFSKILTEHGFR